MKNPSEPVLKIGQAAKSLGVSRDTLRRWEKAGKIQSIRTPGGTRLYSLQNLKEPYSPASSTPLSSYPIPKVRNNHKSLLAIVGLVVFTTFLSTLATVVRPSVIPDLIGDPSNIGAVLQATSSSGFLEINADTEIRGSLKVDGLAINSLTVESDSPGLTLTGNDVSLSVTSNATLDQDLSSSSSPSFSSLTIDTLNLSSSSNQITFNSGGVNGILSWTPTGSEKTITLPDASGEISVLGQKISNSELENSKVTITAGTNLTSGGDVSLGSSVTLALKDSISLSGTLAVSGATTLSSTLAVTGAGTLSSTLAVTGATTLSSTLAVTGATTLNGAVTLGDSTSDTITSSGRFASNLVPSADSTYDLGTTALKWNQLYVNGISSSGQSIFTFVPTGTGVSQGTIYLNPASATTDYTLLGIAVNDSQILRIDAEGDITTTGDLALNGGDLTTTATTATLLNTTATTLSLGGAATTLNLGTTDSVTRTLNLGTGTGADSINIGTGATAADTITLGNTSVASTLTFNSGTTTGTAFTNTLNSLNTGTGIAVNSSSLTTGSLISLSNTNSTSLGSNINLANSGTGPAINYSTTPISAGATGSYSTLTYLPQKLIYHTSGTYNGYLFIVNGTPDPTDYANTQSTVYSAQIKADGTIGSYSTLTYTPQALRNHSGSIYNGYLYILGGNNSAAARQSTVYSAPISSTGTIGSFSTLTYLPQSLTQLSSTVYNGYLFVVTGGSTAVQSTVYSAPINSDGTIGAFSTLTYLPRALYIASAVASNGYLFVTGGYTGSAQSTVYSAPIKADGTLGTFSTLTYLPKALYDHTASVSNGYLYITGGQDDTNGHSTVYSAAINSDGSIGSFSTLTYLKGKRYQHSATTYNGYLFVTGGFNALGSQYQSTTYSAPLQSTALAVNSATSLPSGNLLDLWNNEISKYSVDYNGNITQSGNTTLNGSITFNNTSSNGPSAQLVNNNVPITLGKTGSYSTLTYLPQKLMSHSSAVSNGYLFVAGGFDNSAAQSTVYSAQIKADGTVGSYSTLTYLPAVRYEHATASYNGYLFVVGGRNASTAQSTVYSASISSTGTLGSFSTLTYLPDERRQHSITIYNGYLYVVGGTDSDCGCPLAPVWSAPIRSDGTLGAFSTLTSLPATGNPVAVAYNGYLFVIRGSSTATVWSAPIKGDGTIGSWSTLTSLPQNLSDSSAAVYNGYLYVTGGGQSTVYSALINSDGTIGTFSTLTSLPDTHSEHSSVIYNGYLLVTGGRGGSASSTVYSAPLQSTALAVNNSSTLSNGNLLDLWNNGLSKFNVDYQGNVTTQGKYISNIVPQGDGTTGSYATTTFLPGVRSQFSTPAYNGYLFVVGGYNGTAAQSTVYSARINGDGTLGGVFSTLTYLPQALRLFPSTAYNGYLFAAGGFAAANQSTVYSARINADGTIGAFSTLTYMPQALREFPITTYNGYLFVVGGLASVRQSTVYSAPIKSDGTLGNFSTLTYLPDTRQNSSITVYNGYLFVTGGRNTGNGIQSTVYSAPINSDGTLGVFSTLTYMPQALEIHTSASYNGYLYIIGGLNTATAIQSTVYSAPIKSDGTIGSFSTLTYAQQKLAYHSTAVHNGYLFIVGGDQNGTSNQSTVYTTSLTTSRAFAFNANSQDWPQSTAGGGSAQLLSIQNNGFERLVLDAQGNLRVTGNLEAQSITSSNPINAIAGIVAAGDIITSGDGIFDGDVVVGGSTSRTETLANAGFSLGGDDLFVAGSAGIEGNVYTDGSFITGATTTYSDGSITQATSTTFNLLNTVTTTLNIGGAATAVNLGASTGTTTINNNLSVTGTLSSSGASTFTGNLTLSPTSTTPQANISNNLTPIGAGATGSYSTLTYLPDRRQDHTSSVYNGYLFIVGGNGVGGSQSTVYSAQIKADGTIGSFSTLTYLPQALRYPASSVYNGYLFITGGVNSAVAAQSTVYSAKINSDGTIGSFSTLTYLPGVRQDHTSSVHNGYLFVVGGKTDTNTQVTVWSAPIKADGTIGSFSTLTSLPDRRYQHTSSVHNGYLFITGGHDLVFSKTHSTVWSAPIKADGTIGSFSTLTYLPDLRQDHTSSVHNGYLFITGGSPDNGTTPQSTVYSAPINSDGTIGSFSTLTYLPQVLRFHTSSVYNGYLLITGGVGTGSNTQSTVYSAPLQSTALAVNATNSFAQGNLLDLWNNGLSKFNVNYAGDITTQGKYISNIVPQGDGTTGSYATTTFMPQILQNHSAATYNGYLFLIGGSGVGGADQSTIYSTPIKSDGVLGSFSTLTYLPQILREHSAAVYNGYLLVTGGVGTASAVQSTVYSAPIKSDGTIGAFSTLTYLPQAMYEYSTTPYNGYLFAAGGIGTGSVTQSTVYSAPIKSDGTIGAFSTLTYLPQAIRFLSITAANGYLFVSGGLDAATQSTVYSAPIKADGTIGTFSTLTYLPQALNRHSTAVYNGYLYVHGGIGAANQSTVYSAPIKSDGTIGAFSTLTYLPQAIRASSYSAAVYNGYLLVTGGHNGTAVLSTVYSASLTTSRAFAFNANSQDWPTSTAGGGSAQLLSIQNNGFERLILDAQGNLRVTGNLEAQSITSSNPINAIAGIVAAGDISTTGDLVVSGGDITGIGGASIDLGESTSGDITFSGDLIVASTSFIGLSSSAGRIVFTDSGTDEIDIQTATLDLNTNLITNIGNAGTDFDSSGGLTLAGTLAVNGDSITSDGATLTINAGGAVDIQDNLTADTLTIDATTGNTLVVDTSTLVVDATNNRVGIGDATPDYTFEVSGTTPTIAFNGDQNAETGTWSTNSNYLSGLRSEHSSVTGNGYIYVIGGTTGTIQSTVLYAKLNSDGSTGTWSTNSNYLPVTARLQTSVIANGYIYVMGGILAGSTNSTVYYAKLNSDGSTGSWTTNSNYLPGIRRFHSSIVANGYIYAVGGLASAAQSTVYYAKLNSDGSTGTWSTNSNYLPAVKLQHTSAAANGYLYVIGGGDAVNPQSTVYYAKLNGDGSTGSWSINSNYLPDKRSFLSSIVANGYIYAVGGNNSVADNAPQSTVYYARLNSDGSIGSWSTNSNYLPGVRLSQSSIIANGYIYAVGGTGGGSAQSTIYYAPLSQVHMASNLNLLGLTAQTLGDSTADSSFGSSGGTIYAGNVFSNGSLEVGGNAQLWAGISVNGNSSFGKDTTFNSGRDANTGSWSTNSNYLPVTRWGQSSIVANGYVYVVGGCNTATCTAAHTSVYYAKLNSDGTTGTWTTNSSSIPTSVGRYVHSSVAANGYIYVIGGQDSGGGRHSTVYYAKINSDGSTGSFTTNSNYLPGVRAAHSSVAANGYIYVIAGCSGSISCSGTDSQSTVYYAKLNSDGSTGSWTTNSNYMPQAISAYSASIANGYVYVLGGHGGNGSIQSTIYYGKLNSDGSIGTWSTNSNYLPDKRNNHSSVISNGYLYIIAGCNSSYPCATSAIQSTVYYAKLNSDGSVGTFTTNSNYLLAIRDHHSSVIANGYIYAIGGCNATSCVGQSTVYYAPLSQVNIAGNINLLGINGGNLGDSTSDSSTGSVGGTINAGNILSAGSLEVGGNTSLWSGLSVNGGLTGIGGFSLTNDLSLDSIINLSSTGDLLIQDNGTTFVTFSDSGGVTTTADLTISSATPSLLLTDSDGDDYSIDVNSSLSIVNSSDSRTELSFDGAGSIDLGDNTTTKTIDIGGVTSSDASTINIATNATAADTISIGNSHASTTIAITGGNDWSVTSAGALTVSSCSGCGGFSNGAVTLSPLVTTPIANITNSVTPIAAGATGSYSTLTYLPQPLRLHSATAYSNYLFVVGGDNTGTGAAQSTAYSAPIRSDGTIGSFSTLTYLPAVRRELSITSYNGYLFVSGGVNATVSNSTVYSAQISSTGTLGAFSTLTYLPAIRSAHSIVAYNGYLFITGGYNDAAGQSTVYSAPIKSDGTIGAFSTLTYLPVVRYYHSSAVYNGYLFVVGGYNGAAEQSTVYSAPINADGTIGSFSTLTYLPGVRAYVSSTVNNGYLFVSGGGGIGVAAQSTVWSAQINANGTIGSFSTLTYLPGVRNMHSTVTSSGYLLVVGGNTDVPQSTVWSAPLSSTALAINTSSSFATGNLLDLWNNSQSKLSIDYAGNIKTQGKYISDVVPQGDGATSTYSTTTYLPQKLQQLSSAAYNGYLYVTGGTDGTNRQSTVYSASIKSDGTIGTFSTLTYLPGIRSFHSVGTYNGYLFVVGGTDVAEQSTVYSAPVRSDGTIGSFSTLTYLPNIRSGHSSNIYNGYLYVVGGGQTGNHSTVYSAQIKSDGTIGTFSTLTYLPQKTGVHSSAVYNGYLFVLGGENEGIKQSTVWSAPILSDGTIGSFSTLTYLPAVRIKNIAVAYNGYLYVAGGANAANNGTDTVYSAPVKADGTLGTFSTLTTLPQVFQVHSGASYNGYLFITGGEVSGAGNQSTVYSASLTTSRAFVFNANSQTWPESTGLGGSASLFTLQNNGDAVANINAQGDLLLRGKLSANSVVIGTDKPGDLAENMEVSDSSIEAGDIVSIGNSDTSILDNSLNKNEQTSQPVNESTNGLVKSSTPYQNNIIGVISTTPSITLSPELKNSRPVALSGRVPVKVSSENGDINVGDFLTSSSIPGVAMKATRPGITIGKALESFDSSTSDSSTRVNESTSTDCGKGFKCGSVMIYVTTSYADPNNFLSSLSLDNEGNLIIPKIKTGSITLDPSLTIPSSVILNASEGSLANASPTSVGDSSAMPQNDSINLLSQQAVSVGNRLNTLEDRLKNLEAVLATSSAQVATIPVPVTMEASSSASQSASLATNYQLLTTPDLTPFETLFATGSATLASVNVENLSSSKLIAGLDLSVSNIFKALGDSFLSNTTIAGELTVGGTLTINNESLSSIGTLYLQKSPLSTSLDIFNGKITIDGEGKLSVTTISAQEFQGVKGVSVGSGIILAGTNEIKIPTSLVNENSKVLITSTKETYFTLAVTDKKLGEFTVSSQVLLPQDQTFDWWIINEAEE